jgi:hypothetical protein
VALVLEAEEAKGIGDDAVADAWAGFVEPALNNYLLDDKGI